MCFLTSCGYAPWTWWSEGQSHSDNFIRNLTDEAQLKLPVVNEHTAIRLSAVLCAVRVISEGIAQLPIKVYRDDEGGRKRLAKGERVYQVLHRRPNAWMTSFEWRELMTLHAALMGSGFSIINRVRGQVDELIPVLPGSVETLFDGADVKYRIWTQEGKSALYDRKDVFHLRGPSMDGITALPIVRLAAASIGLAQSLEGAQAKQAQNGGRPSGILTYTGIELSPERRKNVAESWRSKFGSGGEGGTAVLDAGWAYSPIGFSSTDQQQIENRKMQVEEIARIFRVQPIMLMQADKAATYASAEQMFLSHVVHTLGPWVERWENALDRDLLDGGADLYSHLEVKGLMRGSAKDRGEFYARALGTPGAMGWMTPNEVRQLEELDPVTGGDTLSQPEKQTGDAHGNEIPSDE